MNTLKTVPFHRIKKRNSEIHLRIARLLSIEKDGRSFKAYSRKNKLFQKPHRLGKEVVLVESPASRANLLGIRLFLGGAASVFGNSFLLYRVTPYSRLLRIKELVRFFFSIEKTIGVKSFVSIAWVKKDDVFYEHFFYETCGIEDPYEFEQFRYKEVLVGDLIYDEYLRRTKRETIDFSDKHFLRIFYELISYFEEYLRLFNKHVVNAVVASNCVYHFAIPLRLACHLQIPSFQVTSETIYRLSKKRLHAYTEFLDYSEQIVEEFSEFQRNLPEVRARIRRRFSGEIGVDMPYSTKSAFDNSGDFKIKTGEARIKILVATHDFFDSPHSYGFNFYPDFYLWLEALGKISETTNYEWYVKTHPDPIGNSELVLQELQRRFPKLQVIPAETSHHELRSHGINVALTVFGTIGWEYPALGITTINASRNNPHSCFSFSITPSTREEYERVLLDLENHKLESFDMNQIEKFYFLHNLQKLHSFIYLDYTRYLNEVGGYSRSTTSHALAYYVAYCGNNRRPEDQITRSIGRFIKSEDFMFNYRHIQ